MKKIFVSGVLIIITATGFFCTRENKKDTSTAVKELYTNNLNTLLNATDTFENAVKAKKGWPLLQQLFKETRNAYKQTELFAEYYNPGTAKAINGPALPEVEPDNPAYPSPPSGLQVIEELLFPVYDTAAYNELLLQSKTLHGAINRLVMVNKELSFTNEHIFDAIRLEIFRLQILGISGFDSPIAFTSIAEITVTLKSLQEYIALYKTNGDDKNFELLDDLFKQSIQYAKNNNDFNRFNRAQFITAYLNPLTKALTGLQEKMGITYLKDPRPLRSDAKTLFDTAVFNAAYYTSSHTDSFGTAITALGKQLFNETKLSVNNTRSCATCHIEEKAFTDGLEKNSSFDGESVILRNTPSILYSSLQPSLFADSRLTFLEDQARQVIENPNEMHGNLQAAVVQLSADAAYQKAFNAAFNSKGISEQKIQKAIACYIRTKNAFSSRFDLYMRGDTTQMNNDETAGFNLFMGKAKCGTCHFMPLFNGNVPPAFQEMESEVLGVPAQKNKPYSFDKDPGKYTFINSPPNLHAFKTPTARNAAITAPYMHNGVFASLEEVIDFYNKGGGTGLGLSVENQTLPSDALQLTKEEQKQLIAFMHALTDEAFDAKNNAARTLLSNQ